MPGFTVHERRGALWFTFDRQEALNAVDGDMLDGLNAAIDRAERQRPVAFVITGTGRSFTVGGDLRWFQAGQGSAALEGRFTQAAMSVRRLESLPIPVIAALNGITTAGGMELTCFSDLVVAARSATIGDGHANYGLLPLAGSVHRLAGRVGTSNAARLLMMGDLVDAAEAHRMGLVHWVVDDDELVACVDGLVDSLANKPPDVLERLKQMLRTSPSMSNDAASHHELEVALEHARGDSVAEGIAAFAEGRSPRFR